MRRTIERKRVADWKFFTPLQPRSISRNAAEIFCDFCTFSRPTNIHSASWLSGFRIPPLHFSGFQGFLLKLCRVAD
jgi:hypothetical protein